MYLGQLLGGPHQVRQKSCCRSILTGSGLLSTREAGDEEEDEGEPDASSADAGFDYVSWEDEQPELHKTQKRIVSVSLLFVAALIEPDPSGRQQWQGPILVPEGLRFHPKSDS